MKKIDITNKTFNKLTAVKFVERRDKSYFWLFKCECGVEKVLHRAKVTAGKIKSCGCLLIFRERKCEDCGSKYINRSLKTKRCRSCYLNYFKSFISKSSIYKQKLSDSHLNRWKNIPKKEKKRYIHTRDKRYIEWRMSVFKRDNFTCRECKKDKCYLEAHHIKGWSKFPDLRYELDNGITLCSDCHCHTNNELKLKCLLT